MSPDLRHATVFVKPLLGKDEEAVLKALRTNTAYLQREVAARVQMKYAAKLKFLADESFDEGSAYRHSCCAHPKVARDLGDAVGDSSVDHRAKPCAGSHPRLAPKTPVRHDDRRRAVPAASSRTAADAQPVAGRPPSSSTAAIAVPMRCRTRR